MSEKGLRAVGTLGKSLVMAQLALGLVAVGIAGCGQADSTQVALEGTGPLVLRSKASGSAAAGMVLRLEGGAVVSVPAGAVAEGVALDIDELVGAAAVPFVGRLAASELPASSPYVLTPHGTEFAEPIEVSLPIDAGLQHELLQVSWLEDESDTTWESLGLAQVLGQYAVVRMSHFSLLILTAIENECLTDNGGCDPHSACAPSVGGHTCGACPAGYTGDGATGCSDIDECATNNGRCDPHAVCTNTEGGHKCGACPAGYSGDDATGCTDIDECATNNGGCDPRTVCMNSEGARACGACPAGYTGDAATGCLDIDECATNNGGCDPLTVCTNSEGAHTCSACPAGYSGDAATGCADIDECAADNGGCGDSSLYSCQNNVAAPADCSCIDGAARRTVASCGLDAAGSTWQICGSGAWHDRCFLFSSLGEGECRQENGQYPLAFSASYYDLVPHTSGDNAAQGSLRCEQACVRHSDWCLAIEVILRDEWPEPNCSLITDRATFEGAGNTLDNDYWGGPQSIDGVAYQTYCGGNGGCTQTNWNGGTLNPRAGYHCSVITTL